MACISGRLQFFEFFFEKDATKSQSCRYSPYTTDFGGLMMSDQDEQDKREPRKPEQSQPKPARKLDVRLGKKSQLLTPQKPLYGGFYILPR